MNAKSFLAKLQMFSVQVVLCLLIALLIRLPHWGSIPAGLNRDEAALGYNAFSLWKNGTDEHGVAWPVTFRSFGDEKLPGYIYTLIPFIATFGLSATATKLPSLLAGLVVIAAGGYIAQHLSRSLPKEHRSWSPLLVMLLLTISPWGNHFSRVAYEAHLAMAFFATGLASFLAARQSRYERWLLLLSAFGFSAALLTYHSYQIFLLAFLPLLAVLFRKDIVLFEKKNLALGFVVGLIAAATLVLGGVFQANLTKQTGISPFRSETILQTVWMWRQALPSLPGKLVSNTTIEPVIIFSRNVLRSFSPEFFFISGTDHHVHNVSGIGNLHPILAPFVVIGAFWLWQKRKAEHLLILGWFFLALLPGSLTISPTHTVRAAASFPALEIMAAFGLLAAINFARWKRLTAALIAGLLLFSTIRMEVQYLRLSPIADREHAHDRYHLLGQALAKYQSQADTVLTQNPSSSPYMWYLFETQYDPAKLQTTLESYEPDAEHFIHVRRIENITFATLQWPEVESQSEKETLILVLRPKEFPQEKREDPRYHFVEALKDAYGETQYEVWRVGS